MASRSFATFLLNEQHYGIEILLIREINRQLEMTPIPHAADYIRGLLNLRGQIVTILDLNKRLGLKDTQLSERSHNIILKTDQELQNINNELVTAPDKVGFLVDDIQDVLIVSEEDIEFPPANLGKVDGQFLSGVIKQDNKLVAILSVEKLLRQVAFS
ncbi:chemotaxis protein CheW [Vampirovibrio sp.]|uniref:chemotaxis protein CheW n=1 Tax=Vampirovibrio sp. TaxID=2717857 RepID=UPI00359309DA